MISLANLYRVAEAMVPLYAAMGLGYTAVRTKAFTEEQCAGINHFVAAFALPLLIFRMISSNDPYGMNARFLAADSLQKVAALAALAAWARLARPPRPLAWVVTLFSLATLPNTIIMGVPVLRGMYGPASEGLMVQIVVLQFALWYVLVVFLLEYMAAHDAFVDRQQGRPLVRASAHVADVASPEADVHVVVVVPEEVGRPPSVLAILAVAVKKILKIPSTYGSSLGLLWSLVAFRFGIKMPAIIDNSLSIISASAIGLGMFSVGTFMARRKSFITCDYSQAILAMVVRFVVGPAIMVAASLAVGLHGVLFRVAVVQAALPLAVISFVYAEEYNVHSAIMSTGVIVGIFLSVPITILYYILLGL